jgi:hypothetical protein
MSNIALKAVLAVFLIILTSACSACSASTQRQTAHEAIEEAKEVLVESRASDQGLKSAIAIVSEALVNHPRDPMLLQTRSSFLASDGQYSAALADLNTLGALDSLPVEVELGRCMLIERVHGRIRAARNCYQNLMERLGSVPSNSEPDINHVLAAILSEAPEAEAWRQSLLTGKNAEAARLALPYAERERYLNEMFP